MLNMMDFILIILIMLFKYFDLYFYSNIFFMLSFLMLIHMDMFVEWFDLMLFFGSNLFSFGLLMLTLWIMSLVYMIMKNIMSLKLCLNLLSVMNLILVMSFSSLNFIWFYYMFEVSLLLIFFLILFWGYGQLRIMASYYLVFYTLFFSFPLMLIIIYLSKNELSNFIMSELNNKGDILNKFLIGFMMMSFLVKFPMFPVHIWLLKAHVEAPVFGSMILAAIMLKLGSYGMLRMSLIFSNILYEYKSYIMYISLISIIFLSLLCLCQNDMKSLVALSSVVHMGLMLSSMMTLYKLSFLGSYLMMLAHGLCSSGMFYMLNLCYLISNSRLMVINKGLMVYAPSMTLMWFLICSSNMAVPPSMNLVGEIMLLMSLMMYMKISIFMLFMYCLFSFMYSLYFFSYINHGESNFSLMMMNKMLNFIVLLYHWIPLNIVIFNLDLFI
uniref:NADH-ubiquinone oxidoreductase chain 4 n=1 Tax=Megachile sculpturalis TaxID=1004196 RepID=A0A0M4KFE9_9HYME|nr:NADH dehydrogenase subunit 4 [Megachile sculpturalis]